MASLTSPVSTIDLSAPFTLMRVSSGISSVSVACSAPESTVTMMSLMKQTPSLFCRITFIEPAVLPLKNRSVGLSSMTSTSPTSDAFA